LLVFFVFCPHRFASCSLIQTCVPTFPNLSAGFFARTRFLRERRRPATTIHNIISSPPPPTNTLSPCQHSCHRDRIAASLLSPPPPTTPRPHHRVATTTATTTPPQSSLPRRPTPRRLQERLRRRRYLSTPAVDHQQHRLPSPSVFLRTPGESCTSTCIVDRRTSSLASRQSSYVRHGNFTTSIEMRGDSSDSEDDELEYGYRDSRRRRHNFF